MRFVLLAAALVLLLPAGHAGHLAGDGHTLAVGTLMQDEEARSDDGGLPLACLPVTRPAVLVVGFTPIVATDALAATVLWAFEEQTYLLTADEPSIRLEGEAPHTCITPVLLRGASVASAVAWSVLDVQPVPE